VRGHPPSEHRVKIIARALRLLWAPGKPASPVRKPGKPRLSPPPRSCPGRGDRQNMTREHRTCHSKAQVRRLGYSIQRQKSATETLLDGTLLRCPRLVLGCGNPRWHPSPPGGLGSMRSPPPPACVHDAGRFRADVRPASNCARVGARENWQAPAPVFLRKISHSLHGAGQQSGGHRRIHEHDHTDRVAPA
jgi:hypothetical protein